MFVITESIMKRPVYRPSTIRMKNNAACKGEFRRAHRLSAEKRADVRHWNSNGCGYTPVEVLLKIN
jgi:hypothetical protein